MSSVYAVISETSSNIIFITSIYKIILPFYKIQGDKTVLRVFPRRYTAEAQRRERKYHTPVAECPERSEGCIEVILSSFLFHRTSAYSQATRRMREVPRRQLVFRKCERGCRGAGYYLIDSVLFFIEQVRILRDESQRYVAARGSVGRLHYDLRTVGEEDIQETLDPDMLDHLDLHVEVTLPGREYREMLGTHADSKLRPAARFHFRRDRAGEFDRDRGGVQDILPVLGAEFAGEHVHRRGADKPRDKYVDRAREHLHRVTELLDISAVEDGDTVAEGHRLELIVGDIDSGHAELLLERLELRAHIHTELGVEVR